MRPARCVYMNVGCELQRRRKLNSDGKRLVIVACIVTGGLQTCGDEWSLNFIDTASRVNCGARARRRYGDVRWRTMVGTS